MNRIRKFYILCTISGRLLLEEDGRPCDCDQQKKNANYLWLRIWREGYFWMDNPESTGVSEVPHKNHETNSIRLMNFPLRNRVVTQCITYYMILRYFDFISSSSEYVTIRKTWTDLNCYRRFSNRSKGSHMWWLRSSLKINLISHSDSLKNLSKNDVRNGLKNNHKIWIINFGLDIKQIKFNLNHFKVLRMKVWVVKTRFFTITRVFWEILSFILRWKVFLNLE